MLSKEKVGPGSCTNEHLFAMIIPHFKHSKMIIFFVEYGVGILYIPIGSNFSINLLVKRHL